MKTPDKPSQPVPPADKPRVANPLRQARDLQAPEKKPGHHDAPDLLRNWPIQNLVFWDDESNFLNDLSTLANPRAQGWDLRTCLADAGNHLIARLNEWAAQGWWPDLLCIDLNSASGNGIAGIGYLSELRQYPQWQALPIVLTSKTQNTEEDQQRGDLTDAQKTDADLVTKIYSEGADGYALGKVATNHFLANLRQQLPAWQHHARQRVWQDLLQTNHQRLQQAHSEDEYQTALQETLQNLLPPLGVKAAFIRQGGEAYCPIWVKAYAVGVKPWDSPDFHQIPDIPYLAEVVVKGNQAVVTHQISTQQAGPYKALVGRSAMGCALMWQDILLGVMTVVGDAETATPQGQRALFDKTDQQNFERLAAEVAAALFSMQQDRLRINLSGALLKFGQQLTQARDEHAVCQALADTVHRVVHEALPKTPSAHAKCTVRLIEPGYPFLRRYGAAGDTLLRAEDLSLEDESGKKISMAREVVRKVSPLLARNPDELRANNYLDMNTDAQDQPLWTAQSAITLPLAMERPDSTDKEKIEAALGSMNLECTETGIYDRAEVQPFLKSLALSASQHITNLRTARFADAALDMSVQALSAVPDELWHSMHKTLFSLLGHNLLVQLEPPEQWDGQESLTPWQVRRVFSSDEQRYTVDVAAWQKHFSEDGTWPKTFTRSSIEKFIGDPEEPPQFTAIEHEFIQSTELFEDKVLANAVLPMWDTAQTSDCSGKRLVGVMLLSWFSPPVMNRSMFQQVLSRFADYSALLLAHSNEQLSGKARLQRAEAERSVALAARQFQHVLNNSLGTLGGNAELGINANTLEEAKERIWKIRRQLAWLQRRANKSALYFSEPSKSSFHLAELWAEVLRDMTEVATQHSVTLHPWGQSPEGALNLANLEVWTDRNYLWNAMYVLVDNAIEALEVLPQGQRRDVWVSHCQTQAGVLLWRIQDNGPGVAHPEQLFVHGKSTKSKGQGVALALAQERLALLGVSLKHIPTVSDSIHRAGAVFEMGIPL